MKHLVRAYSLALLAALSMGMPVFAEETAEPMTEDTVDESTPEEPGLHLGSLYRLQMHHCPRLLNMEDWKACRKKRLEYKSTILDQRRKVRGDLIKDHAQERSEETKKPLKKVRPEFTDFNQRFRNFYIKESPLFRSRKERHIGSRADVLRRKAETGGSGQRSRMMEEETDMDRE